MRRNGGAGTLRLRVGLRGSVALEFKQVQHRYTRVYVGYDADADRYALGCRLSF
jgi:hypothetical protein